MSERQFFVTTTVVGQLHVFAKDSYCQILVDNISHYQQIYGFEILAYVIMPSHFHWVVEVDLPKGSISDIMRDIKKYSAWDLFDAVQQDGRADLLRLFAEAARRVHKQRRKLWNERFDDRYIRDDRMLVNTIRYIHDNPVKSGLAKRPEDYRFSSARNYALNDHSIIRVKTDWFCPPLLGKLGSGFLF